MRAAGLLLVACMPFAACTCDGSGLPMEAADLARADGVVPVDAAAGDLAGVDLARPDGGACDTSRLTTIPPMGELAVGSLCDDVVFCLPDAAAAQAAMAAAPGFVCRAGPGGVGAASCAATEQVCEWEALSSNGTPGIIDADELDQICAVTVLPTPPATIVCIVYI